jgi:hypothetical protein
MPVPASAGEGVLGRTVTYEGRRALLGLPAEPDAVLMTNSPRHFERARTRRFGMTNPERISEPFWEGMIRSGISGHEAMQLLDPGSPRRDRQPIWSAQRFGQSLTFLSDGRILQIGGEHEDSYHSDFCIYNDVFVHGTDGSIQIYGYPEEAFPPTDFHTATLVGDHVYIIGSLGYFGTRHFGDTPIYRLDVNTFRIERLEANGDGPGWISRHRAMLVSPAEIHISGGKVAQLVEGQEAYVGKNDSFTLDIERLEWRRQRQPRSLGHNRRRSRLPD